MITSDLAVNIIEGHIINVLSDIRSEKDEWKSISQWAACTLINKIMDKPYANPIDIIQKFYDELEMCEFHSTPQQNYIFRQALEEVEAIGCMLV